MSIISIIGLAFAFAFLLLLVADMVSVRTFVREGIVVGRYDLSYYDKDIEDSQIYRLYVRSNYVIYEVKVSAYQFYEIPTGASIDFIQHKGAYLGFDWGCSIKKTSEARTSEV